MNFPRACLRLTIALVGVVLLVASASAGEAAGRDPKAEPVRIVVTFPATARSTPGTGRVLLFLAPAGTAEPRRPSSTHRGAVYAIDVKNLAPGQPVTFVPVDFVGPEALAFPVPLGRLDPGAYAAQVVFDFDETTSSYNEGPGNLYSVTQACELRGSRGGTIAISADHVIAPPAWKDSEWVKYVEIESPRLTAFHHRSTKLRAAVILPSTFTAEPTRKYPVIYVIPGFGSRHTLAERWLARPAGQRWMKGDVPLQALRVVLDPDVPLGHSVFANSDNNGPVGDALVHELIPEMERRFRAIPAAGARFVTGHSSGGWASLWLQVAYPDAFGGCWSLSPDPVDFRAFQTVDLYSDHNGFWTPTGEARATERSRTQVVDTLAAQSLWEYVIGYGDQLDSFDAVFSPRGADGHPMHAMDKLSGAIDQSVVEHWKRYDIRLVLEQNWRDLGPRLHGKLHVITGAWDTYYLEGAVERLAAFLRTTDYGGYVVLLPGNHSSVVTPAVETRVDQEMAEAFAQFQRFGAK